MWIVGDSRAPDRPGLPPARHGAAGCGRCSSDADHIITPSTEGPTAAIRQALAVSGVGPGEISSWDLHATATPGDYQEVATLRAALPETVLVTARKGIFGHGMGAAGGWELTAQYLGYERGRLFPDPLTAEELNPEIAGLHSASCSPRRHGARPRRQAHGSRRHQRLRPLRPW